MTTKSRVHFSEDMQIASNKTSLAAHKKIAADFERISIMREKGLKTSEDFAEWLQYHNHEYIKRINSHSDAIAIARSNDIENVITNAKNSMILLNNSESIVKNKFQIPQNIIETHNRLNHDFYDYVRNVAANGLVKNQTGTSLIEKTIDLNGAMLYQYTPKGVSIPADELSTAAKNIWDKKRFMSYDLETLGGIDHTGQQVLDAITEFSFGEADTDTGKINKYYGSIIGITPRQHDDYMNIIHQYESGSEMSGRDQVILKRLAKTGHANTSYKSVGAGLFEYTSFANDIDIKSMNTKDIRSGAEQLLDIYKQQEKSMTTYGQHKVYSWEKRFIEGLQTIKNDDLTLVGHNSGNFDMPMLNRFIQSGRLSQGARAALSDLGMETIDLPNRHFDTLAALRIGKSNDWSDMFTDADRKMMKEYNLTHNTLEALTRKFVPDYYESKVAHVGKTDIGATAAMLIQSDIFQPDLPNYVLNGYENEAKILVGNGNMLFYAQDGVSQDRNRIGALSFVEDAMTGDVRTFGGIRVGAEKAERELFGQYGFQKGVSYTLDSLYGHEMTDEWGNVIRKTHPDLDSKQIVTATFKPVSDSSSFKSNSPITLVGTKEEVQQQINQHLLLTGTKTNGKWVKTANQEIESLMSGIEYDPTEKHINPRKYEFTIEDQLRESTLRIENEAASRARRDGNIKKEMGLLQFFDDMDAYVNKTVAIDASELEREIARKNFHEIAKEKSLRVARGVAGGNLDETGADIIKSYHEYFGWKDKNTKEWKVYRETVDAALNSENYALSVRKTMGQLVKAAQSRGGKNDVLQAFYFNQYYTGLQAHAAAKMGGIDAIINTEPLRIRGVDKQKFDIDLSGYINKSGITGPSNFDDTSNIMALNLEKSNAGLANRLLKMRGYRGEANNADKIKEIKNFTNYLIKTSIIDKSYGSIDMENHTLETATQNMLEGIRNARSIRPMAGRILAPKFQNVTIASKTKNFGLSEDEVSEFIRKMNQTMPNVRVMSKNILNDEADKIVENVLFNYVDKAMLQRDGYSLDQATDFMNMRQIRMEDTKKFMKDFLHGLSNTGTNLLYDEESRNIHLIAQNGVQTQLNNLPKDIYENGRFYTKIGNMKVVSPIGVYSGKYGGNLELKSLIGKAHDNVSWMESAFQRGIEEDDVAGQANNIISYFAKSLRESSSVMKDDMQNVRANGFFATGDIIPELQNLYKKGVLDGITFKERDKFIDLLKSKKKLDINKNLSYEPRTLIAMNMKTILQAIAKGKDGYFKQFAEKFSFSNKNPTKFVGSVVDIEYFGEPYSKAGRGVHHQVSRARRFNIEEIRNKALSGISVGRSLHTSAELAQAKMQLDGLSFATESAVRVNRISISTKSLRSLTNMASGKNSEYIETMLNGIHLDEGSAVASPELLDQVFSSRTSTQKIMLHKIAEYNNNVIEDLKVKRNLAPKINISKDGKISFSYSNGVFVHRGEDLISINGYKGSTSELQAKEKGMFRFGAFVDGILATQRSIQNTLNADKNKERIFKAADKTQEAIRVLNETYDLAYYVDAFDANPHRKLAESNTEKNMTHFLAGGFGTSNNKIAETFKALGMKNELFQVANREYIDALGSRNIAKTAFGALVSKQKGRLMTHKEISEIIKSNYGSVQDFQKALYEERNAPMKALKKILVENKILGQNESVHFLSDNFSAEKKHENATVAIQRITDQLMYKYKDDANKVHSILKNAIAGLKVENGNLVAPNEDIFLDKLEKIVENEKLKTAYETEDGIKYDKAHVSLIAMEDHDRPNFKARGDKFGKGMKFTDRNLQMLEWERYNQSNLERVRAALDPETFKSAFSHVLEDNGKTLKKEHIGRAINKSIGDQIREAMFAEPGDELLMSNGHINKQIKKRLESLGVNVKEILESISEKNIANIGSKYTENFYSVSTGILSRDWNTGRSHNTLSKMTDKAGFEIETLGRLISSTGGNQDIEHSLYGRKIMLDLHMDELGKNQLYSSQADRYIALPYEPKSWIDQGRTEEARTPFQKQVASLQNTVKTYISNKDKGGATQEEQSRRLSYIKTAVQNIKESIDASVTAKKSGLAALAEAHLDDSGLFKAHGIRFFGNETSAYYKALEFDGKNLVKEAAKGISGAEYDATFVSRDFINTIYNEKYLKSLGIEEEELLSHIKTKGTLSINVREPADYKKSASISNMYLSDVVTGNQALSTAIQWDSKKGDYDGDSMGIKILKGQAYIKDSQGNRVLRDIDYSAYQILKGRNSYVELTKDTEQIFADAIASMHYNAADYNKMYRTPDEKIERNSISLDGANRYAPEGKLQRLNKKYTDERRRQLQTMYTEIQSGFGEYKSENMNDIREAMVKHVRNTVVGDEEQRQYIEAVNYGVNQQILKIDDIAKQRRAAAGEINHYLYYYKSLVNIASDRSPDLLSTNERGGIQKVVQALQEGFLSPKNETSIDTGMLEEFKSSFGEMMGLNGEADGSRMMNFLNHNVRGRKEMDRLGDISREKAFDAFSSFGSKVRMSGFERDFLSQGILQNGIGTNKALIHTGYGVNSMDQNLDLMQIYFNKIDVESPLSDANIGEAEQRIESQTVSRAINKKESEGMMSLVEASSKKIMSGSGKMSLGVGAVGLAGSIMLAGFVGGNPSRPAETHAQDDVGDDYAIPPLSDTNLNVARGGPQQGYVININAQTDQGQEHASSAIQQALNTGFGNTNINVAMNIKNSSQATYSDINKMLMAAFQ